MVPGQVATIMVEEEHNCKGPASYCAGSSSVGHTVAGQGSLLLL